MTSLPAPLLEGLKDGSHVPLLDQPPIYLFVPDCDGQRFADLFRKTCNQLPGHATKRIRRHWCATTRVEHASQLRPKIELVGGWSGRGCDMSGTSMEGNHLAFYKPAVDRMPDHLVETLIARELARVFDAALVGYFNRDAEEAWDRQAAIADSWGYDDDALDDWWVKTYRDDILNCR